MAILYSDLQPQEFAQNAVTALPAIDFYQLYVNQLPQLFQAAPNFLAFVKSQTDYSQYLYDIIRSLLNIYNIDSESNPPSGAYLQMLANDYAVIINPTDTDPIIKQNIMKRITLSISRGSVNDFANYFNENQIMTMNNTNFVLTGNATISITVPASAIPVPPSSYSQLELITEDLEKIKAAGIKLIVDSTNPPLFGYLGDGGTQPNVLGYGIRQSDGSIVGGGHYS